MTDFMPVVALDRLSGELVQSGFGTVHEFGSPWDSTPLAVTDMGGVPYPGNAVPVTAGLVSAFKTVDAHDLVEWRSGGSAVPMWSPAGQIAAAQAAAEAAASAATDAATAAVAEAQEAIDTSVEALLHAEGYAPLRIVEYVEDIPPGTPPGVAFLVLDVETPIEAPVVVDATSASSAAAGSTLTVDTPAGLADGDVLVAFCTAQTDSAVSWAVPTQLDTAVVPSTTGVDLRTSAVMVGVVEDAGAFPSTVTFTLTGSTGQRRAVVLVAVRGADVTNPVAAGEPAGFNGVGTTATSVPAVTSTTPRALHLVAGWSNGNTTGGQSPDAPSVDVTLAAVEGRSEPASPSGGFTTLRVWQRELTSSGSSGTVLLDWPLLSQRAGVSVVVRPPAGA